MDAGSVHHVEGSVEQVLMDICRAIHPDEYLDVEAAMLEHDEFWLTESRGALVRHRLGGQELIEQIEGVHVLIRTELLQSVGCDLSELSGVEVGGFPRLKRVVPEAFEK